MPPENHLNRCHNLLFLLGIAVLALSVVYTSPYQASDLSIVPDETEYALAALSWVETGRLEILVGGNWYPSRYPPCFSLLIAAPAYILLGSDPGNAIVGVTLAAILSVVLAFCIGRRISGTWGGLIACCGILALPEFYRTSTNIMTDAVSVFLALGTCLAYMKIRQATTIRWWVFPLLGLICAIASALRAPNAALLLPLALAAIDRQHISITLKRWACLLTPVVAAAALTMLFNNNMYGSPFRNGYNVWCPVPYDYPSLTFNGSYVLRNLPIMFNQLPANLAVILIVALLCRLAWHKHRGRNDSPLMQHPEWRYLLEFTLLVSTPIIIFFAFYFVGASRFILVPASLLVCLGGGMAGCYLHRLSIRWAGGLLSLCILGVITYRVVGPTPAQPLARMAIDDVLNHTPDDAVIISAIATAQMEYLACRQSHRQHVPLSRRYEYASKIVAFEKIENPQPPPKSELDSRCAGLLDHGAIVPVEFVAMEDLERLVTLAQEGRPIYITPVHLTIIDGPFLLEIKEYFAMHPVTELLYRLDLLPERLSENGN